MKTIFLSLLFIGYNLAFGQNIQKINLNKDYSNVKIEKSADLTYKITLKKGITYKVSVLQQGIDVMLILKDNNNKKILENDSPNGKNGLETFEYLVTQTNDYYLIVNRLNEKGNPEEGKVSVNIQAVPNAEIQRRAKIKKELAPENNKTVQTLDIDHFWEAFDQLKNCKTHADSLAAFQKIYLDKATDGLLDFVKARSFTAEKFVSAVSRYPKFYNSVRKNTYEVKKAAPLIDELFIKFKNIYPNFKPFKVCFAIGIINTGGTVSDNFVLIGTEVSTSTKDVDLTEFNNSSFSKILGSEGDLVQKIKNIVAHECVHTQQTTPLDKNSISCALLGDVMKEGFCDFIGELIAEGQINKVAQEYGDQHEKELWKTLKDEMCTNNYKNWLYNYSTTPKGVPADLGYYMGYQIAREYYKNAADKKQAVVDIIEMNNPLRFLEISKYDQKIKK